MNISHFRTSEASIYILQRRQRRQQRVGLASVGDLVGILLTTGKSALVVRRLLEPFVTDFHLIVTFLAMASVLDSECCTILVFNESALLFDGNSSSQFDCEAAGDGRLFVEQLNFDIILYQIFSVQRTQSLRSV